MIGQFVEGRMQDLRRKFRAIAADNYNRAGAVAECFGETGGHAFAEITARLTSKDESIAEPMSHRGLLTAVKMDFESHPALLCHSYSGADGPKRELSMQSRCSFRTERRNEPRFHFPDCREASENDKPFRAGNHTCAINVGARRSERENSVVGEHEPEEAVGPGIDGNG